MLLEYEKQIFADLLENDGLLVMARGLGIYRIIEAFMKAFCHPASLLLVINASTYEEDFLIERLANAGVEQIPKIITSDITREERLKVYMGGGVAFVSSRILVMDLLTDKLPAHLISGILVYNAHRVKETGLEAFIMRLYRQKNKEGFIKAFSDNPVAFTDGFCKIETIMRNLYLRKLFLYPRFHVSVKDSLEKSEPEVIELGVPTSAAMKGCQMALLELINLCIKELRMCNSSLDLEGINYENLISTAFDAVIRVQLEPIWHQLTSKTKQLVSDLKLLRELLRSLTHFDCVTFYSMVRSIKASEKQFKDNAGWLYTESADKLYMFARQRLYGSIEEQAKNSGSSEKVLLAEKNPKWSALSEIMDEICVAEEALTTGDLEPAPSPVLIAVDSPQTCSQIKDYLLNGAESVLKQLLMKLEEPPAKVQAVSDKKSASKDPIKPSTAKKQKVSVDTDQVTLTQLARGDPAAGAKASAKAEDNSKEGQVELVEIDAKIINSLPSNCKTALVALRTTPDPNCLIRTLDVLHPKYVIMFDLDIPYIRQLEIYKACRPGTQFRVYIMMFSGSSEEQKYLTAIRKEKSAFEELIKQKATMVIPENRDGKLADTKPERDLPANQTVSTRKGGHHLPTPQESKVIVDMREFRSDLPYLIHKLGVILEPATLEVGDYILTEDICVERKSVPDLIGSLNNGRLYSQCVSMSRYYKRPVLLIEFDPTRPFTLQKNFSIQQEISINDIQSRLALLTLHFPKLRLLWCQSSNSTAKLFRELKRGATQPDVDKALTITSKDAMNKDLKYNVVAHDSLLKLPSISVKNVSLLADKVRDIKNLAAMDKEALGTVLSNVRAAEAVSSFLNTEYIPEDKEATKSANPSIRRPARRVMR
ncbi:DNA repair endonuclease XPF-like [Watersipora subatra]|uniref:DNA repair endonuclease XPF-like n=1 Tax=Watersipora subatra TaxID=2589382 RepID=UPI00355BAB00